MIALINQRPMFPACKHRMALARISPGERGFLLARASSPHPRPARRQSRE